MSHIHDLEAAQSICYDIPLLGCPSYMAFARLGNSGSLPVCCTVRPSRGVVSDEGRGCEAGTKNQMEHEMLTLDDMSGDLEV